MAARRERSAGRHGVPRVLRGKTIGVLGAGQTGGSLIRRLGTHRPQVSVLASDRDRALARVVGRHARWCDSLLQLVRDSDVLVLAVPVHDVVRLLSRVARLAARRTMARRLVVCDVSTIKGPVVAAAARHQTAFDFVGLHPLAGVERSGWRASSASMFAAKVVLYSPAAPALDGVARAMIRLMGGRPVPIAWDEHDRLVATTIGLPHVLAYAAAGLAERGAAADAVTGGSWRSLTRVAVSSPAMVAGFLHGNVAHQLRSLRRLRANLDRIERCLRARSLPALERQLGRLQRAVPAPRAAKKRRR